jgi:hypothetical protein
VHTRVHACVYECTLTFRLCLHIWVHWIIRIWTYKHIRIRALANTCMVTINTWAHQDEFGHDFTIRVCIRIHPQIWALPAWHVCAYICVFLRRVRVWTHIQSKQVHADDMRDNLLITRKNKVCHLWWLVRWYEISQVQCVALRCEKSNFVHVLEC